MTFGVHHPACAGNVGTMSQNDVLANREQRSQTLAEDRAIQRVRHQKEAYVEELNTLVQAAFVVVGRTGSLDAPVREILKEAQLSNQAFYRHVDSKDELLLLMLDAGRRSLVRYLERQMEACSDESERTAVWIRGVLAQAQDEGAARRTRPFIAQVDRLAELFPEEQRRSEDLLIEQIAGAAGVPIEVATAIYDLAFGALARHLRRSTIPSEGDADVLIALAQQFARRGR